MQLIATTAHCVKIPLHSEGENLMKIADIKEDMSGMSGQKGKVHLGPNVSSSAHYHGCVVNGSGAMAAI